MEHIKYLVERTRGLGLEELQEFYKSEYKCRVSVDVPLFAPMYTLGTKFNKLGALATRGTVFALNESGVFDGEVVCLPFFKFFNEYEKLAPNLQDEEIIAVQRKYDGSLIKVFEYSGEWRIATNGTCSADTKFRSLFETAIGLPVDKFGQLFEYEHTYVFELCSPENEVKVKYEKAAAFLLLTRCRKTLEELKNQPNERYYQVAEEVVFDPKEKMVEGVVVIYSDGQRMKRKTNWYRAQNLVGFDGSCLGDVEDAIHLRVYDDVAVLCTPELQEYASKYIKAMNALENEIESSVKNISGIQGLVAHDKTFVTDVCKDGSLSRAVPKPMMNTVVNVLRGQQTTLYDMNKGKKYRDVRNYLRHLVAECVDDH